MAARRCVSLAALLLAAAAPSGLAAEGCGAECRGTCFGGTCLLFVDPDNEDALDPAAKPSPRAGTGLPPAAALEVSAQPASAKDQNSAVPAKVAVDQAEEGSTSPAKTIANAMKAVQEELRRFEEGSTSIATPAPQVDVVASPQPKPLQLLRRPAAPSPSAEAQAGWYVASPPASTATGFEVGSRSVTSLLATGPQASVVPTEEELSSVMLENRRLRAELQAARSAENQLGGKVALLQARLHLWERAGKRVAERESRVMDLLTTAHASGSQEAAQAALVGAAFAGA